MNWYFIAMAFLWFGGFLSTGLTEHSQANMFVPGTAGVAVSAVPNNGVRLVGFAALVTFVGLFFAGFWLTRWWLPLASAFIAIGLPVVSEKAIPQRFRSKLAVIMVVGGAGALYQFMAQIGLLS
jgi:hypothetical protein